MARTGRRPGPATARKDILVAAREAFTRRGYHDTSIRAIARDAGVDIALVHYYFGSKRELFTTVMRIALDVDRVIELATDGDLALVGERTARYFFSVWEGTKAAPLVELIRYAVSQTDAGTAFRDFVLQELVGPIAAQLGSPDASLRADLVGSQLIGLVIARYILRLEPIASADPELLIPPLAATIQSYLDDHRAPSSSRSGGRTVLRHK